MSRRLRRRLASEDGIITVIVALMLVLLLGVSALVIDLGRTRHARQQLQDAVDSASIAAADYLPANSPAEADTIKALALRITLASSVGVPPGGVITNFWCVLRIPPNALGGPTPDLGTSLGSACGPVTGGAWNGAAGWVVKGTRMSHACDPYVGDLCNAVKVQTSRTLQYLFAPTIGIASGSTGVVQSVACQGACKRTGNPLDVALVLDRTGSMSSTDVANVKAAAIELLKVYDPAQHSVAVLALPYPQPIDKCKVASPQDYPDPTPLTWRAVPLSTDYKNAAGVLNPTSGIVTTINCLALAGSPTIKVAGNTSPSQSHTNLGDPMAAAADLLRQDGRDNVPDVIIFMTDGQANQPWDPAHGFNAPCGYAGSKADTAKTQGVAGKGQAEIYTIGYGIDSTTLCPDTTGTYQSSGSRPRATTLLADMATSSTDNAYGTSTDCTTDENGDGDHYFCEDKTGNLAAVFKQVAIDSVKRARLIDVD